LDLDYKLLFKLEQFLERDAGNNVAWALIATQVRGKISFFEFRNSPGFALDSRNQLKQSGFLPSGSAAQ
jgi:hypothetical protein